MIRCPRCGRRLHENEPNCPLHGAPTPEAAAPPAAEAQTTQSDAVDLRASAAFLGLGYRVIRVLGRGGFGVVYGAERLEDQRPVAIKVALPEQPDAATRLTQEATVLETIGPPHVPRVFERGALVGQFYVVLEYIADPTLAERLIGEAGRMTLARFASVANAILAPLEAIHERGIVHRDLKPENIFLGDQGDARIVDFGLARDHRARAEISSADDVGTAEYMSPEQCDGLSDADRRSDIYSMGVLLYEMLSGAPPFWGKAADVREAHRSQRPAPLDKRAGCPPELDQVIRRCLAKDRARRYADVAALRDALETALSAPSELAHPAGGPASTPPGRPKPDPQPKRPSTPAREKRTVGLVFFASHAGLGAVQPALTSSGGQIVQTNGSQYVAAFGHDIGDNPARIALLAAQRLLAGKLSARLLVDVAQVSVQVRPDGSRRVFSPVFSKKDHFPTSTDPTGVILTGSAIEVLPHLRVSPIDGRAERFVLALNPAPAEPTTFGVQLAPLVGRNELLRELVEGAKGALAGALPTLITVVGEPGYGRSHLAGVVAQQLERTALPRASSPALDRPALSGADGSAARLSEPARPAISAPLASSAHERRPSKQPGAAHERQPPRMPGIEVIRLAAQEGIVGAVSQTLPELLRRVLPLPDKAPADFGRALICEQLGEAIGEQVWAAAALLLGWIEPDHPAVRRLSAAPSALRLAAARAAGEALRKSARDRALALLLDDAHLADEATLDALEYATLKEAGARIWACVLVRPSFARARPTWGMRAAQTSTVTLTPLEPAHAAELARRLLLPVEHVPPQALARLAERTQGVPRLLVELVRGLKRDGLVRRSERGIGYYLATDELEKLPDLPIVQWNARREVDALPARLAGHARLASVLGSGFTAGEVEELLQVLERSDGLDDMQLDASVGIQRLIDAGVLIRHRSGLLDFRHSLLRDTIYQLVPEDKRKKLHRAAYELYRKIALPNEQRLPRLALHAARCGEREAAAQAYLELAERALKAHAYLEAEAAFGGALENLPEAGDGRIVSAERGRGLMRFRLGRHEDAVKDLERARQRAHAEGNSAREAELMLDEATVLDWMRDFPQSAALVHAVSAIAPAQSGASELLSARLAMSLARVHHRRGEAESCVQLGMEAAARARALGDEGYETREIVLLMIAPDCANLGRLEEAEGFFEAAIVEAEAHGDLHHLGAAHSNRIFLWFARRDVPKLFQDLARTEQIARELGAPLIEYVALCNFGEVEYAIEQLREAKEHTEQALVMARQLWGETSRELATRELLLARIALYGEDLATARELARRIRKRSAEQRARGAAAESELLAADQAMLETVELGAENADEAAWQALAERCREVELQPLEEVEILEIHAQTALRTGARELSRALFERALSLSREKPNLLSERVARKLSSLFGAQARA